MAEILVRPPRPGDGEGIARSWIDAGRYYEALDPDIFQTPDTDGLAEHFEEELLKPASEEHNYLVAEIDGRVVGWIFAHVEAPMESAAIQLLRELGENRLIVDALVVEDAYRRQGVGTRLMHVVEEWAAVKGATLASLDTYIGSPISIPFYEHRMGYTKRSVRFRKELR